MNARRLQALIGKDVHRLLRHRGAALMAILLAAAALLVSSAERHTGAPGSPQAVLTFWVDYWADSPWIEHLRRSVPVDLADRIRFRCECDIPTDRQGILQYERSEAAVQIRNAEPRWAIWFWHSGTDTSAITAFENWFWRESQRYFQEQALAAAPPDRRAAIGQLPLPPLADDPSRVRQELLRQYRERIAAIVPGGAPFPEIEISHASLHPVALSRALGSALILFAIFLVGVCLLPAMTCEERERGTLAAQILSPATALEMFIAKLCVFLPLAVLLALAIVAMMQFSAAIQPLTWGVLVVAATAACALGSLIAAIAPTQRSASLAAMGYALGVALIVFAAQRFGADWIGRLFVESHVSPLVVAALNGSPSPDRWAAMGPANVLALGWLLVAACWIRIVGWRAV